MLNFFQKKPTEDPQHNPDDLYEKIDSINIAARQMIGILPAEGLELSRRSYQMASEGEVDQEPYKKGIADALFNLASFNLDEGNYHNALTQVMEALNLYYEANLVSEQIDGMCLLAEVYLHTHEYSKAVTALLKALEMVHNIKDQLRMGVIRLAIGEVYLKDGEDELAIDEFRKAMKLLKHSDNEIVFSKLYHCLANAYFNLENYEQFEHFLKQSQTIADEKRVLMVQIHNLFLSGRNEIRLGNVNIAIRMFEKARDMAVLNHFQTQEILSNIHLSEADYFLKDHDGAIQRLLLANSRSRTFHFMEGILISERKLADLYAEINNFEKAYEHFKIYYELEHSICSELNDVKSITSSFDMEGKHYDDASDWRRRNSDLELTSTEKKEIDNLLAFFEEHYRRLINMDAVTLTNSERYFNKLTDKEIQRVVRYHQPLSMIILNVEDLEKIKNRYGNSAKNQVLKWIAGKLKNTLRVVDVIGRHGGEAFILLLPHTPMDGAKTAVDRILCTISNSSLDFVRKRVKVTFRTGITEFKDESNAVLLIQKAESALKMATSGGN